MAKKRATLKEIKATDEFQEAMGKVVEFFRLYGGWVGAAAGVVLAGGGLEGPDRLGRLVAGAGRDHHDGRGPQPQGAGRASRRPCPTGRR